jgi:MazG family protein
MKKTPAVGEAFEALVETIKRLRDPETGCPWDLAQTHDSLKQYAIEETYELLDAIDSNPPAIKEELGDLLLQILLHSQIASDEQNFSIADVVEELNTKLIARHPHVFGDAHCEDAAAVTRSWEKSKQKEKRGLLDGIPTGLPALLKAQLIGERTERVGFDWIDADDAVHKVKEEVEEYLTARMNNVSQSHIEEEFGDLLFSLVQLARKQSLNAEELLQRGCSKFTKRFQTMEQTATKPLSDLTSAELQELWQAVKK